MKIAYFDCFSGVCGSMILASLVDAGMPVERLKEELSKIDISGYEIRCKKVLKDGIYGTHISIDVKENCTHRHLKDIFCLIDKSCLDSEVKNLSKEIFYNLAVAEAKIHHKDVEEVHFHEVGAVDSIVDVVGTVISIKALGIEKVYSSKIHVGSGFVECQHGTIPVPAPATLELLKGIPVYSMGISQELTTPTGAAILKTLSKGYGSFPSMKIEKIGYGAGDRNLKIPNLLRVSIGEIDSDDALNMERLVLLETNVDDLSPEIYEYLMDSLFKKGALDVFITPVIMKKSRPASLLSVLVKENDVEEVSSVIFRETTTLGIRIHSVGRLKLMRDTVELNTPLGKVAVKVGKIGKNILTVSPEYEDCKRVAIEKGIPLKWVYQRVLETAHKILQEK